MLRVIEICFMMVSALVVATQIIVPLIWGWFDVPLEYFWILRSSTKEPPLEESDSNIQSMYENIKYRADEIKDDVSEFQNKTGEKLDKAKDLNDKAKELL